jgi:hypothetical protein
MERNFRIAMEITNMYAELIENGTLMDFLIPTEVTNLHKQAAALELERQKLRNFVA